VITQARDPGYCLAQQRYRPLPGLSRLQPSPQPGWFLTIYSSIITFALQNLQGVIQISARLRQG